MSARQCECRGEIRAETCDNWGSIKRSPEGVTTPPDNSSGEANLPIDERAYCSLVDALGQDEDEAQAALDAVLPFMREAWDDGYYHGAADERDDPGGKAKWPNPFLAKREAGR